MASKRTGQCLCGAVSFSANIGDTINACHCIQCQRWTGGGPLMTVRATELEMIGEDRIEAHHASEWGERAVCGTCGSTLYWRMQGKPVAGIAVGLLDDQSDLNVGQEIFTDYRPDWMPPFAGANQSTVAQEMAKLEEFLAEQKL